jgi:hypothetical protein
MGTDIHPFQAAAGPMGVGGMRGTGGEPKSEFLTSPLPYGKDSCALRVYLTEG